MLILTIMDMFMDTDMEKEKENLKLDKRNRKFYKNLMKSERYKVEILQLKNPLYELTYISFPSFEEFCKIANIELLFKKIDERKNIDEERMRKYLKKINKFVEDCEHMEIHSNEETSFDHLFPYITDLLYHVCYNLAYKYEKDLENKIANKMWKKKICSLNFFLI